MGLRPEDSNLTAKLPKKSDRFTQRSIRQPFTTDRVYPSKKRKGFPTRGELAHRANSKLGESATAVCRCQGEGTAAFTTQLFYFLSFALKGAEEQTDAFG